MAESISSILSWEEDATIATNHGTYLLGRQHGRWSARPTDRSTLKRGLYLRNSRFDVEVVNNEVHLGYTECWRDETSSALDQSTAIEILQEFVEEYNHFENYEVGKAWSYEMDRKVYAQAKAHYDYAISIFDELHRRGALRHIREREEAEKMEQRERKVRRFELKKSS
jgi:hypothetical protein